MDKTGKTDREETASPGQVGLFFPRIKAFLVLVLSLGTTMMAFINMGAITAASPDLSGTFVVGVLDVSWSGAASPLGFVLAFIFSGYLWSRVGLRRAFRVALLALFLGSLVGFVADYFFLMVAARWLQGFGSGMLLIYGTGALMTVFSPKAVRIWTIVKMSSIGLASCTSPLVGCFLVQYWHWRGLFVLVGIAALVFGALSEWLLPDQKIPKQGKFDWPSFFLLAAGCVCILMSIIHGETDGWDSMYVQSWMYGGACAFVLLAVSCLTHKNPMLNLSFFLNARFLLGLTASLLNIFCICWIRVGVVQYMRNVMLYEPRQIGLAFLPCIAAFVIAAMVLVPLIIQDKVAPRLGMMLGLGGLGGAAFFLARLSTSSSVMDIEWPLVLFGCGYAFCLLNATPLALRDFPLEDQPLASRLLNTVRYTCISLYTCSVSTVISNMNRDYRFSVAEQTRESSPGVRHTLEVWQEHFLAAGATLKEASAEVQAFLGKAVTLQTQVFAMDRFFIVAVLAGCIGILVALCCLRPSHKKLSS